LSKADVCATDKRVGLSGASIAKLSTQQVVAVFPDLDADRSYRDLLRLEGIRYDRALVAWVFYTPSMLLTPIMNFA
jgi:hypothetical protein